MGHTIFTFNPYLHELSQWIFYFHSSIQIWFHFINTQIISNFILHLQKSIYIFREIFNGSLVLTKNNKFNKHAHKSKIPYKRTKKYTVFFTNTILLKNLINSFVLNETA